MYTIPQKSQQQSLIIFLNGSHSSHPLEADGFSAPSKIKMAIDAASVDVIMNYPPAKAGGFPTPDFSF